MSYFLLGIDFTHIGEPPPFFFFAAFLTLELKKNKKPKMSSIILASLTVD